MLTIKEKKHQRKKNRPQLKYENKTHSVVTNESTVVVQKEKIQNKLSWNNLFINQTYLLGADLLQQGVPKE